MELVNGEDLAVLLRRGPLSIESAVAIATTVVDALSMARGNGVVHRDLKPANVMLTAALSPTVTSLGTVAGVILGTAAYMSPEQARGRPVDRRSDIWALLPAATPPAVHRLLRRCLEKNSKDRLHDAADARIELAHAFDEGDRADRGGVARLCASRRQSAGG